MGHHLYSIENIRDPSDPYWMKYFSKYPDMTIPPRTTERMFEIVNGKATLIPHGDQPATTDEPASRSVTFAHPTAEMKDDVKTDPPSTSTNVDTATTAPHLTPPTDERRKRRITPGNTPDSRRNRKNESADATSDDPLSPNSLRRPLPQTGKKRLKQSHRRTIVDSQEPSSNVNTATSAASSQSSGPTASSNVPSVDAVMTDANDGDI